MLPHSHFKSNSLPSSCQGEVSAPACYPPSFYSDPSSRLNGILRLFRDYKKGLEERHIVLRHKTEKWLYVFSGDDHSRYFPQGRARMRRKIRRALDTVVRGVFLTLTYDPKRITCEEAWWRVGQHVCRFLDALNKARSRRGARRRLAYFLVLEAHASGYPHIHIVFPGLRWLGEKERVEALWGRGMTRVQGFRSANIGRYVSKYLGKVSGWPEISQAYSWLHRTRWYHCSRDFYRRCVKTVSEWVLFCVSRSRAELNWLLRPFINSHRLYLGPGHTWPLSVVVDYLPP